MSVPIGDERRRHPRYSENLRVKATWPGHGTQTGETRDFSSGGTFLLVRFDPAPPAGTMMQLQLDAPVDGGEAPVLKARVVRIANDGIAFEFP